MSYPYNNCQEEGETVTVQIGSHNRLVVEKAFGPTVFADLRLTLDYKRGCWVVERKRCDTGDWRHWTEIPAQLEDEFEE